MRQFVAAPGRATGARVPAMTWTARSGFALITLGSIFAFAACGDDDDAEPNGAAGEAGAPANAGGTGSGSAGDSSLAGQGGAAHGEVPLECRVLGELCHAADTGPGPARDCHELGHVGNAQICATEFDGCIATCTDADVGSGGAGGAGGDDARCAALGSLCHDAGEVDADAQACHELGHIGNAADCAASFVECATLCLGILEELEEPGAGGAAGAGAGGGANGGAGGSANGGAGGAP